MKIILAFFVVFSVSVSFAETTEPCISLETAQEILTVNLLAQGNYVDQQGVLDDFLVQQLEYLDGAYQAVDELEFRENIVVTVTCLGEYSLQGL